MLLKYSVGKTIARCQMIEIRSAACFCIFNDLQTVRTGVTQ